MGLFCMACFTTKLGATNLTSDKCNVRGNGRSPVAPKEHAPDGALPNLLLEHFLYLPDLFFNFAGLVFSFSLGL